MYGIFTYIWLTFMVNVGIYTIHGSYGYWKNWGFSGLLVANLLICSSKNQLEPQLMCVVEWSDAEWIVSKWLGYKSATPYQKVLSLRSFFQWGLFLLLPLAKKMLVIAKLNYHSGIVNGFNGFNDREFWREPVFASIVSWCFVLSYKRFSGKPLKGTANVGYCMT